MATQYARGSRAWGICGRSGRKMYLNDMVFDGHIPNMRVDPAWYEPKHPQEHLLRVDDPVALWRPAPENLPGASAPVLTGELNGAESIDLAWTESVSTVSQVDTYLLYRAVTPDGSTTGAYVLIFTLAVTRDMFGAITNAAARVFTDTDIAAQTTYDYYVAGIPIQGPPGISNEVEFQTTVVELGLLLSLTERAETQSHVYSAVPSDLTTWTLVPDGDLEPDNSTFTGAANATRAVICGTYQGEPRGWYSDLGAALVRAANDPFQEEGDGRPTDAAYGNGVFVCVGGTEFTARAASTTDGTNWVNRTQALPLDTSRLSRVIWSEEAQLFIVTENSKGILTSPDGVTWDEPFYVGAGAYPVVGLTASPTRIIAAFAATELVYSDDLGATWQESADGVPENFTFQDAAFGADLFVVVGTSGDDSEAVVYTSSTGIGNWTKRSIPSDVQILRKVVWTDFRFVAIGNEFNDSFAPGPLKFLTSTDGINWTLVNPGYSEELANDIIFYG